jgi:ABC-type polysaccharide/polyol phosphate transport system ATPase subunit
LLNSALRLGGTRRSKLWAVRGLDLDIERGETIGIIGRNGSGKTTTLRMLAGVTAPTEGTVSIRGRVAPLISVGVGFHDELTGRENVYVNGQILGMTREEIDDLFDSIVAFAELQDFIDTPVKFYSSGMWLRLGFSVAVAAHPDILVVDEVLAVGDLPFQMKSYERMLEMKTQGATIVVVSHNLNAIRNLCSRVLVLQNGQARFLGPTIEAISAYHALIEESTHHTVSSSSRVTRIECELLGPDGLPTRHLITGDNATVRIRATFGAAVEEPTFALVLSTDGGLPIYSDSNHLSTRRRVAEGQEVVCDVRFRATLTTGSYLLQGIVRWDNDQDAISESDAVTFFVSGRHLVHGIVDLGATFSVEEASGASIISPAVVDGGVGPDVGGTR